MWILQLLAKVQKAAFSMKKHEKSKILARFSKHENEAVFSGFPVTGGREFILFRF